VSIEAFDSKIIGIAIAKYDILGQIVLITYMIFSKLY